MRNNKNKSAKKSRNVEIHYQRPQKIDNALMLRPEYKGQPVTVLKMKGVPSIIASAITSGVNNTNIALSSAFIQNFAARFIGFSEFRIVRVKATCRNFSSQNLGIANMWFSEDDSTTPNSSKALDVYCKQFNFSEIVNGTTMDYTPHDPAQQTWTLVSSGSPVIGYFKLYTDNANFGSPAVVTQLAIVTFTYTVQFRGLL